MTRRERILGVCVGGAIGGLALAWVVQTSVIDKFNAVQEELNHELNREDKLEAELDGLWRIEADWQEKYTQRTLSADPREAGRLFKRDIMQLLDMHGLLNDADTKATKINPIKFKVNRDNDFFEVSLTFTATGTMNEVVGFLRDFYRRDYIARLDKVRLTADQSVINNVNLERRRSSKSRRGRSGKSSRGSGKGLGPDGPLLSINVTASTLVLPQLEGLEHPVMEEIMPLERGRQLENDLAAYNEIFENSLFEPYQPKPVVAKKDPGPKDTRKPVVKKDPDPPPAPPSPRRVGADQQFVVGTTVLNGERIAYVIDERENEPPKKYFLDEPMDDGTLLLIHPRGLVVRVKENGREKDYFYRLGDNFADRAELNEGDHPEICQALEEEFLS